MLIKPFIPKNKIFVLGMPAIGVSLGKIVLEFRGGFTRGSNAPGFTIGTMP